jgi:hypothetical protein
MNDIQRLFERRVGEEAVARVLEAIARIPNRREHPEPTDSQGQYDFGFDGGAGRIQTGVIEFCFKGGTLARLRLLSRRYLSPLSFQMAAE